MICKLKWFFDLKYISPIKITILYSFIGTLICFIGSIIATKIKCVDKNHFNDIINICTVSITNENNLSDLYYDNIYVYLKDLWRENRTVWINLIFLIMNILKIFLTFLRILYIMMIIESLSPEYLICANTIFFLIIEIIGLFIDKITISKLYNFLAQFFAFLGIVIYLEFIELNFCGLNYNLKKNIEKRGKEESNIENLYNDENERERLSSSMSELQII